MLNKTALHTVTFQSSGGKSKNPLIRELSYIQFPGLSESPGVKHAVFTRKGGVSETCYDSLNISFGTGDHTDRVRANLRIITEVLAAEVVFAIRAEMARTLTDIVYRRLMVGLAADQGRPLYEMIAAVAASELGWSDEERHAQLEALHAYTDSFSVTRL